ncbi:hypothetical protein P3W45_001279 [Vairimorpha bombi]|jgi:hypothetical protein
MEDRVKKLLDKGYFKKVKIDEKGFGTFRTPFKPQSTIQNDFCNLARSLKKEADLKIKSDKNEGIFLYIKAMFNYIKGYRNEEDKISREVSVGRYKGLYKYIYEISKMVDDTCPYMKFLSLSMFTVKFHSIYLEFKGLENGISKNILELHHLYKNIKDFPKIDELEDAFFKWTTSLQ